MNLYSALYYVSVEHLVWTVVPLLRICMLTDQSPKPHCPQSMDYSRDILHYWHNYMSMRPDLSLAFALAFAKCDQTVPGSGLLIWLIQRHLWVTDFAGASWIWLFVLMACARGGARVSYHASARTGRRTHCVSQSGVYTVWSVVWMHSNAEWMGSDWVYHSVHSVYCSINGTNYTVWVDFSRYSVGRWKILEQSMLYSRTTRGLALKWPILHFGLILVVTVLLPD